MSLALVAALIGLAVLDASTLSTLLIPLWLLAKPGAFKPQRLMSYLTVIASTYFIAGLALLTLAQQLTDRYLAVLQGPMADRLVMGLGGIVVIMGIIGLLRGRRESRPGPSLLTRFRDRAVSTNASTATLALSAVAVEAATMWPYLVGISLITANGPGLPVDALWLALYNGIMIAPAAILTWARVKYPAQTDLLLTQTRETMTGAGSHFTAWLALVLGSCLIVSKLI